MRRVFALVLGFLMVISVGAFAGAEDPAWIPAGFSFYEEPGFDLFSVMAMEDGGVVLAGRVRDNQLGLAVRLSEDGEVVWRVEEQAAPEGYPYCEVLGTLSDGRVLLLCAVPEVGMGFTAGTDVAMFKAVDDQGNTELLEELTKLTGAGSMAITLSRVPGGFVFGGRDPGWEGGPPREGFGPVVVVDDDLEEVFRAETAADGELPFFEVAAAADGGYFLYGRVEERDATRTLVRKLNAGGEALWSLEDDTAGGGVRALGAMPDGGLVMLSTWAEAGTKYAPTSEGSNSLSPVYQLTRVDADGKALWSRELEDFESYLVDIVPMGGGVAVSGFAYDELAGILVLDGAGERLEAWHAPEIEGHTAGVQVRLSEIAAGGVLAAGSVHPYVDDGEMMNPLGVVYGALGDGMF